MVDIHIQSATAEIIGDEKSRRRRKKKKPRDENIMPCPIPSGGHNKLFGLRGQFNVYVVAFRVSAIFIAKYCDPYVYLSVCLSVRDDIS